MGRAAVISKGHLLTKRQPPGLWVLGGEELRPTAMTDNGTPVENMTSSRPAGLGNEESLPWNGGTEEVLRQATMINNGTPVEKTSVG